MEQIVIENQISVSYEEMNGSPVEELRDDGLRATRRLKCAWDDRLTLVGELTGKTEYVGDDTYAYTKPASYPWDTNSPPIIALGASIEPFGDCAETPSLTTQNEYDHAVVTVEYGPNKISTMTGIAAETMITERIEPSIEFIQVPSKKLYYQGTDPEGGNKGQAVQSDMTLAFQLEIVDWIYTFHRLPYIPAAWWNLRGKVNASSITSNTFGKTFAAETVLMRPATITRDYTQYGPKAWKLELRMSIRDTGWNKFPKPGTVPIEWAYLLVDNEANWKPYLTGDFSSLLIL